MGANRVIRRKSGPKHSQKSPSSARLCHRLRAAEAFVASMGDEEEVYKVGFAPRGGELGRARAAG
jgi:hypothetical protein